MARPKKEIKKVAVSVTLDAEHLAMVKIMGAGNVSKGLEKILDCILPLYQERPEKPEELHDESTN